MKLNHLLISIFVTLIYLSFMSEIRAQEKDIKSANPQSTFKFTGRVRTYYEMITQQVNVSAEETEVAKVEADSRFGISGSFVEKAWTALFKLELDSHPNAGDSPGLSRDAYIQAGNRAFDFRIGRYRVDGLFPGAYESFPDTNNNLGELHGLTQSIKLSLKGLPIDLDVNYISSTLGNDDITGNKFGISSNVTNDVTFSGSYSTKLQKGNAGLSTSDSVSVDDASVVTGSNGIIGDNRDAQSDTMLALLAKVKINGVGAIYSGFHIQSSSQKFADSTIVVEDTVTTRFLLGVNYDLAAGAGAHIDYSSTSLTSGSDDPQVTTVTNISYTKPIVGKIHFRGGHSLLSTDTAGTQGVRERIIAVGLQINF